MNDEVQRDLGRMEAELSSLKFTLDLMRADLKEVKEAFHELRGGTKTLLGVAAILGSAITYGINWILNRH